MRAKRSATVQSGNLISGTQRCNESNIFSKDSSVKPDSDYFTNIYQRYFMQRVAQQMLLEHRLIHCDSSYWKCHRKYLNSILSVYRNPDTQKAYYSAVETCGNVKSCPVCAPRIMAQRSTEIRHAVHSWLNESPDNTCYLLTLTFSHSVNDRLDSLLVAFSDAVQRFWRNGSVKRAFSGFGYRGRITSLEIQYSRINGFHPHQHVLIFCKKGFYNVDALKTHWITALDYSGLKGISDIALTLFEARSAEQYLTKISSEMAMGNLKQGRGSGHFSPMQVLSEACRGESWAESVFAEYYSSTRSIHSLYWSKYLKQYFGISDKNDFEISQSSDDLHLFCDFPAHYWKKLSLLHRAYLIACAGSGNFSFAHKVFSDLGVPIWKKYSGDLL